MTKIMQGTWKGPMIVTTRSKNGMRPVEGWQFDWRGEIWGKGPGLLTGMHNRRYRTMEAAANRLQKEAKGYLDSLRGAFLVWCRFHVEIMLTRRISDDGLADAHCRDDRCFLWRCRYTRRCEPEL